MSNDLDLRGIDQRHEPDPQFRAALQSRLASIVAGTDPGSVTEDRDLATIDLEPTSAKPAPPEHNRRRAAKIVLVAAAVVAVIAVVATRDDDATPADQPSPTVTVPTTTTPRALAEAAQHPELLAPGTYFLDGVVQSTTPRIFLTVGSGWSSDGGMLLRRSEVGDVDGFIVFDQPVEQYSDACHWKAGNRPGWPTRTLDEVVAALTEQKGWADVTTPSDISIDGYAGKAFQRTAPTDISNCDTTTQRRTRTSPAGLHPEFNYNEPGDIETFRVLDIDGTVVVVLARQYQETSAAARAEFAAVLDSIRIERGSDATLVPGFDTIGAEVNNPLELVSGSLLSGADVELFRVISDEARYWRVTTLPEFDGRTWQLPSSAMSDIADTEGSQTGGHAVYQQLQIVALQGQLIPAAADPMQVAPSTDVRRNSDTDTLLKTSDLQPGDQFTIMSKVLDVTPDELRAATTDNPPDDVFLELPDNVPGVVSDLASEVTTAATTDYDRMIALQDWFRTFDYSTDVQRGHSSDAIETFLETRSGYCEQFASAFAVMARTLGIPSRVAVGYTPGELNADGSYSVLGRNAHTWPEIWFDDIGWVPFEPTPLPAP